MQARDLNIKFLISEYFYDKIMFFKKIVYPRISGDKQ